jgi:hypothetical protein
MRKRIEPPNDALRKMGYETRDVSIPTLLKWVAGLFFFVGASSIIAFVLFLRFAPSGISMGETTVSPVPPSQLPPAPRIQGFPIPDMQKFRADEDRALTTYAWQDRAKGMVRIPIAKAIDLEADRLKVEPPSR